MNYIYETIFPIIVITSQLFLIFIALFAIYKRATFKKYRNKLTDQSCAIFLPCKGVSDTLEQNLRSFFSFSYKNYKLFITVESEADPAVPLIRSLISEYKRGELVIAGESTTCCQKNHNLLGAIEKDNNSDIYIFADSDIELSDNWIGDITAPLIDGDYSLVTGFRWLYASKSGIGDLAHSFQNIMLYSLFSFSSATLNTGVWGGSMAITRKEFEDLDISSTWARATVDDMSLSQLIKSKKRKSILSYSCIVDTTETISNYGDVVKWFRRQVMYLKAHQKLEWSVAIISSFISLTAILILPFAIFNFINDKTSLLPLISGISILVTPMILVILSNFLGKQANIIKAIIVAPISQFSVILATLKTLTSNVITWSGIRYKFRFIDGTVTKVER